MKFRLCLARQNGMQPIMSLLFGFTEATGRALGTRCSTPYPSSERTGVESMLMPDP